MGVVLCSKHGRSGISLVCQHLKKNVDEQERVQIGAQLIFDVGDMGNCFLTYWFCPLCSEELQLPKSNEILPDSNLDQFDSILESLQPVCGKCFLELRDNESVAVSVK